MAGRFRNRFKMPARGKKKFPLLMGILNVTPDSFFDGGRHVTVKQALQQARQLLKEGADIIDVGAESTRPGAKAVSLQQELQRALPVVKALVKEFPRAVISIDTQKSQVAKAALDAGAQIVNDVSALQFDAQMAGVVARAKAKVVLMHMRKNPQTMQRAPKYKNVVEQVQTFLQERIDYARESGIAQKNIWVDPGIGFGKNLKHNLELLKNLSQFKKLGAAVLLGCSRKSFIALIDDGVAAQDRLAGSLAAAIWAERQGADILRVHDVAQTRQALKVWQALL